MRESVRRHSNRGVQVVRACAPAAFIVLASVGALHAQVQAHIRDSVLAQVSVLASAPAAFRGSHAVGSFSGSRAPFNAVDRIFQRAADSVLVTLVDCMADTTATTVRYLDRALSRGGLCYLLLHNLVYHEDDDDEWPGNYFGVPTRQRLLAAQRAWRPVVRRHAYSPS